MNEIEKSELITHLSSFLSEERNGKFDSVLSNRTRKITVVLEDIYQSHNASAVIRSCELFGIQDIHVIEGKNKFSYNNEVSVGSAGWVDIYKYGPGSEFDSTDCYRRLKDAGYTIVAATPDKHSKSPDSIPVDDKIALLFGTEENGLSEEALANSDYSVTIPMYGFTESFNVSVACSLILRELTERLRRSNSNWNLSITEISDIKYSWLMKSVKNSDLIVKRFLEERVSHPGKS